MSLVQRLTEYISACFTGIWLQSHEHEDALAEIANMCREQNWRLATFDVERGLQIPGQSNGQPADAGGSDPLAAIRAVNALASADSSAILVLVNFHRFLQSAEIVQALAQQITAGKQNRTFVLVLAPVVQIPTELEKLFCVVEHDLPNRVQLEAIARGIATQDGELPAGDGLAVSPSSVYRVLKAAGRIGRSTNQPSKKGTGFQQPQMPHEHWHIDISYINIHGTFYYLSTILDGYSRYIVHWEIRRSMTEQDELVVLQRAREKFPHETPRIISDNGSQFLAKDFKEFIRICGMTHVRTSPYYPQSNGKLERFHGSIKGECIRPGTPISLEDALRIVGRYVEHYNEVRLHSAIGYVAPADKLAGREAGIFAARDRKLAEARERRKEQREAARLQTVA